MTAATARCHYCETDRPAAELFEPYQGVGRCRDEAACSRRQLLEFDPTLMLDEERRQSPAPASSSPAGAVCAACHEPGDLYPRGAAWLHRDRELCEWNQAYDLAPQADGSPDRLIAAAGGHLRLPASHPPEVGPAPVPIAPAEMRRLADAERLGAKRR